MAYEKNDMVTVTIEDVGMEGEGIGKIDGFPLFIKDAVVGDTVEAKIIISKKNFAYARVEKVVTPSPFRVEPPCKSHRQCGGCQIQALSYDRQLAFKQDKVRNNLLRIGGFSEAEVDRVMEPVVGMENPHSTHSARINRATPLPVFMPDAHIPLFPIRNVIWAGKKTEKSFRPFWTT